jgi:hypothetical protein
MSSSGKTTNLALNQWIRSDPVVMDDFNADNEKTDAAVKAAADSVVWRKIAAVVTSADAQQIDLDLTALDLTGYTAFRLLASFWTPNGGSISNPVYLRVNDVSSGYLAGSDGAAGTASSFLSIFYSCSGGTMADALLVPVGSQLHSVSQASNSTTFVGETYPIHANAYLSPMTISKFSIISDTAEYPLKSGARLVLLGMKI